MNINLSFLSEFRSHLMGLAIFWIFFYHVGVEIPVLHQLFALGWFGVDIFFLVSGFGLCASLSKNASALSFYHRRFIRIIPTWWLVLLITAIIGSILRIQESPHSLTDYFYWFSGLGWWTNHCNYEWYIPTLILFYILTPFLTRLSNKDLILGVLLTIALSLLLLTTGILRHVYMSYSRLPVFILGIISYKYFQSGAEIKAKIWFPCAFVGIIVFVVGLLWKEHNLVTGLTISRLTIPLFIIPMLRSVCVCISHIHFVSFLLVFFGTISLEMYLLHINHEFTEPVCEFLRITISHPIWKLIWFVIVVMTAWMLHFFLAYFVSKIKLILK